ncbi:uncharacterized protein LOC142350450 [Convolutriloba macropyga]|uniref:uncharacterized protein LOC142350450 n=1 Tax=Convolutriloba macropyga TaxID=536237 RepID=UPI003F51D396
MTSSSGAICGVPTGADVDSKVDMALEVGHNSTTYALHTKVDLFVQRDILPEFTLIKRVDHFCGEKDGQCIVIIDVFHENIPALEVEFFAEIRWTGSDLDSNSTRRVNISSECARMRRDYLCPPLLIDNLEEQYYQFSVTICLTEDTCLPRAIYFQYTRNFAEIGANGNCRSNAEKIVGWQFAIWMLLTAKVSNEY